MQRGDLVIEIIPALVKAPRAARDDLVQGLLVDHRPAISVVCQVRGDFQQVEDTPGITVGRLREPVAQFG